jgi:hypothetical protein
VYIDDVMAQLKPEPKQPAPEERRVIIIDMNADEEVSEETEA